MEGQSTIPQGKRRESRLRLKVPAQLIILHGRPRVHLVDLSRSGARVYLGGQSELRAGEEGVITWLDYEAFGEVKWSRNGFAGFEFDVLLDPGIVLGTRKQVDHGLAISYEEERFMRSRDWFFGYK
ncbi:PilZ domain-containing protein [Aurantiacibacter poecillastricola]|uniref:PilZ domain-containing protein n=1 Tax=Aurantiacibacter poecillastricola TaxID=3064385 RepID=UPI00273EE2D8|nr:PilZ domain-containing protein [Aurantiacibacter sp. 219JJ12-13]MDP5261420.1 PilZ domain-containing protein [Aurantiacibacter sp. 219JJ12-13]